MNAQTSRIIRDRGNEPCPYLLGGLGWGTADGKPFLQFSGCDVGRGPQVSQAGLFKQSDQLAQRKTSGMRGIAPPLKLIVESRLR